MTRHVMMLALVLLGLLASCEPLAADNTATRGAGTVPNYSGDGADLRVVITDAQGREVTIGEGRIDAAGAYTYTIERSPRDTELSALFADLPSCAQVSDRNAMGVSVSVYVLDGGEIVAALLEFMDAPVGAAILVRTYVDRDVRITGTCSSGSSSSLFYKVDYGRGWNLIYLSDDYGGLSLTSRLSPPSADEVEGLPFPTSSLQGLGGAAGLPKLTGLAGSEPLEHVKQRLKQ